MSVRLDKANYDGPEMAAIRAVETGSFYSHRAVWWLIFGGVFERFPALKHVITETPGNWFPGLSLELDAIWDMFSTQKEMNAAFYDKVPRKPSEYMNRNLFFGASFASPYEAEQAVLHGFQSQLMWGSDYPHLEGTFVHPDDDGHAVGDEAGAAQHVLCHPAGADPAAWWGTTPSRCTTSTAPPSKRSPCPSGRRRRTS